MKAGLLNPADEEIGPSVTAMELTSRLTYLRRQQATRLKQIDTTWPVVRPQMQ